MPLKTLVFVLYALGVGAFLLRSNTGFGLALGLLLICLVVALTLFRFVHYARRRFVTLV